MDNGQLTIKASDLRIGNYVIVNRSKFKSIDIGNNGVITQINSEKEFLDFKGTVSLYILSDKYKDTFGGWVNQLHPIPITEEWLLKFGFKNSENSDENYLIYEIDIDPGRAFCINYDIGNNRYTYLLEGFGIYLYFIHEVQNLFHSIFKIELTIK